MGQRANLAIGNASGYELFYSHWCANTLPRDLFWGSDHSLDFIAQQRRVDANDGWLDTIWAEGGAVIDPQENMFLLYGGEDLLYDVPLRRVFLKLLEAAWEGWTVRWAYEGIVDIAEYCGVDRAIVIADSDGEDERMADLAPPRERDWLQCIGTIRTGRGVNIYPLNGFPVDYLLAGPQLISSSGAVEPRSSLDISEWTSDFPSGGFHVDLLRNCLDFWIAYDCPNSPLEVADAWKNWTVNWHKDCFEAQIRLTNSALKIDQRPQLELLADLIELLNQDSKPVDIVELAQRLTEHEGEGKVEINPFAIRDDRLSVGPKRRKEILARCIATLNDG